MTTQTIVITGASSGIGKVTAQHFAAKGWNVVATMRTPEQETDLQNADNMLVTRLDVIDRASIDAAVAEAMEKFGQIDVLLNNAGYGAWGPLEAFTEEKIRRQFDVNVIGLLETTKAVLPHMRAAQRGTVVNVSSVAGRITLPFGSMYHGTKWAVEGISEALSFELSTFGGRVKIIEPGAIATDFAGRSFDVNNDESLTEYQGMFGAMMQGFAPVMEKAAPASLVAETIYEAVHDESDRLRYLVGEDAKAWAAQRDEVGDVASVAAIRAQFCL